MPIFSRLSAVSSREERQVPNKNCCAWEAATKNYEFSPRQSFPGLLAGWDTQPPLGMQFELLFPQSHINVTPLFSGQLLGHKGNFEYLVPSML